MQWAEGGDEAVGGFGYKLQTRPRMIGHDGSAYKKRKESGGGGEERSTTAACRVSGQ